MTDRSRLSLLTVLLVLVCLGVGVVTLSFLYRDSLDRQRSMLQTLVDSQSRAVSSLIQRERTLHPQGRDSSPVHSLEELVRQELRDLQKQEVLEGSLEMTAARKDRDGIRCLVDPGRGLLRELDLGEPMRNALAGRRGTLVGRDRAGRMVVAGFAFVPELEIGLVAKVALSEFQAPFLDAALRAAGVGAMLVLLGLWGIRRVGGALVEEKADLKELVEGLLRHGDAGVYSRDQSGRFTQVNGHFEAWVGAGPLIGADNLEKFPEEFARLEEQAFQQVLASREAQVSIDILDGPDRSRILLMQRFPLMGGRDVCQGVATLATDITEEQAAARELEDLGQLFQQLLAHLRGGYWLRELPSGDLLDCSSACADLWGLDVAQLQSDSRAWLSVVSEVDRERVRESFERDLAQGLYQAEYQVNLPDGTHRWLREVSFPHRDESGEIFRVGGLVENVTERHDLQEQLLHSQKLDALGGFAAAIAHDFNNHLAVILGEAEFLSEECPDGTPGSGQAQRILEAAGRASRLTRQVLAFGRKQEVRPIRLDVGETVEGLREFMSRLVGEAVRLEVHLPSEPMIAEVDPAELEQVIMNLTTNARDAMPGGGILRLSVEGWDLDTREESPSPDLKLGRYVLLQVKDTGGGIAEKVMKEVFEPFFTTKAEGKGTGLGLALVQKVAVQCGGTVVVRSSLGEGATFQVYLPRQEGKDFTASYPGLTTPSTTPSLGSKAKQELVILLVEDEDMLREVAQRTLARMGYRVLVAESGNQALTVLAELESPPDILFTDMVMPGMSGGELAEKAHALGCRRILFTSGYSPKAMAPELLAKLRHDFLPKPYRPSELEQRIRALLS